jgi:hypothetical protein
MYNLTNFKRACETGDINLIEQVFYLLPRHQWLDVYSINDNSEIKDKIIDLYRQNLTDAESLTLFAKTRIDLERFSKKNMKLLESVLDSNISEIKKCLIDPDVDPGFFDQVVIRNTPSLKIGKILVIHPLVDPCYLLNEKCLDLHHQIQADEYYRFLGVLKEAHKLYLKSLHADEENKKLYKIMISEILFSSNTRINIYLNFVKSCML